MNASPAMMSRTSTAPQRGAALKAPLWALAFAMAWVMALGGVLGRGAWVAASEAKKNQAVDGGVNWQEFDEGLREAARRNKYTFIDLYTDWCGYCRKMDLTTFRDKAVAQKLAKDFVSIKFNAESNAQVTWKGSRLTQSDLAMQWGVEGFPTLLFLNSKGEIIGNFGSYADADLMVKLLGYIASGSREKGLTFDEYLKKDAS